MLGRPYNTTYEIIEPSDGKSYATLHILSASELLAEGVHNDPSMPGELSSSRIINGGDGLEYELLDETGDAVLRSNREVIDDPNRQKLSMDEIETLKREGAGGGRDLISRLMDSHSGIAQKTAFSLAKYTLRKSRKFMRRFTVLPLDVAVLARWLITEKEPMKILEIREEILSLLSSCANIRWSAGHERLETIGKPPERACGRWLVVDDTGGLVVATLAERLGVLFPMAEDESEDHQPSVVNDPRPDGSSKTDARSKISDNRSTQQPRSAHRRRRSIAAMSASSNTLTVLHANNQPNLSLLKYFLFDTNNPSPNHPLYTHLKTLSWLQLLSPDDDTGYAEPEVVPDEILSTWKTGKRATYYRKRRRWSRVKSVVDETRVGAFDGLIIASTMDPISILQHTVPLLRGGAPVVIYSPHVEPLTELADMYSTTRRTAFLSDPPVLTDLPNEDFPVNPSLLLAPTIQTATLQRWQCLPGRTHPLMSARGGGEGYLFTATRVLPAEGRIEARGKFKRKKARKDESSDDMPMNS